MKKKVKQNFADTEYERLAKYLKKNSKYNNKNVLICWHHGQLIHLTKSLGVQKEQLPLLWPEDVFGWLLRIRYDKKGAVKEFTITNVKLMYNDVDKDPATIIKKQLADFKTTQNSHEGISENSLPKPFYEGGKKKPNPKRPKKLILKIFLNPWQGKLEQSTRTWSGYARKELINIVNRTLTSVNHLPLQHFINYRSNLSLSFFITSGN